MSLNPPKEKLGNEIPDVEDILKDILLKTNNIHVSFLFAPSGELLLRKLTLSLCCKNSSTTSGWQDLSHKLNLGPFLPNYLQNHKILQQDPLYHILVAYTQIEEGTIGKVYEAIYDTQRYDVITYTESYVNEFYEAMCRKYVIPQEKILKPAKIPEVPVILKNEQNKPVEILKDILLKTKNIHVSFLFTHIGHMLLNKLSLCLCSTNSLTTSEWQDLSLKLNLEPFLSQRIQNCNFLNQDPLYYILLAYTQIEEATIGKVYQAVYVIQSYDSIVNTETCVDEFCDEMCKEYIIPQDTILKPSSMPAVPLLLQREF